MLVYWSFVINKDTIGGISKINVITDTIKQYKSHLLAFSHVFIM